MLNDRFQKYRGAIANSIENQTPGLISAHGSVSGQNIVGALPAFNSFLLSLINRSVNAPRPQVKIRPLDPHPSADGDGEINVPAYAWMPLAIPANAVSLSFAYKIQGDWKDDSFAAALNGTNVLSITGSLIETNVIFNSGEIDVSVLAGRTNEFFVGIVGGTSTNAELTLLNLVFHIAPPPSLSVEASGSDLIISWPLSTQNFVLEVSTNLGGLNSWTAITNTPAIVDLQNTVTNPISGSARYYRLKN